MFFIWVNGLQELHVSVLFDILCRMWNKDGSMQAPHQWHANIFCPVLPKPSLKWECVIHSLERPPLWATQLVCVSRSLHHSGAQVRPISILLKVVFLWRWNCIPNDGSDCSFYWITFQFFSLLSGLCVINVGAKCECCLMSEYMIVMLFPLNQSINQWIHFT